MIDLDYDDVDAAFGDSVAGLCESTLARAAGETPVWTPEWWRAVADLGVLGLTTPDGGGTLTTVAAVMEALGAADAPGPFVETFMALQVLGETDVVAVAAGDGIAEGGVDIVVVQVDHAAPCSPSNDTENTGYSFTQQARCLARFALTTVRQLISILLCPTTGR